MKITFEIDEPNVGENQYELMEWLECLLGIRPDILITNILELEGTELSDCNSRNLVITEL